MDNRWSDRDADAAVERLSKQGINLDLALRTYSTRLLGAEPRLVIHGGGNTSVKTRIRDLAGDQVEVLCVKGSGWDMATIEPAGLPAVRLAPLRRLETLESMLDEDMVNAHRGALLNSAAPNPSVETLLHAFLPHKFIDHTHANPVLALTDQPDGEELCHALYGRTMALVPYVMPGFALAKRAAEAHRAHPHVDGLILLKHGIFTFGDTARQAYERMIDKVTLAEERIAETRRVRVAGVQMPKGIGRRRPPALASIKLPDKLTPVAEVAPIVRGALAEARDAGSWRRWVLEFRTSPAILEYVNGKEIGRYACQGTATPDHVIRTKAIPLILPAPEASAIDVFTAAARDKVGAYTADYQAYFERNNARVDGAKRPLDPLPRVVLVPGVGLFGVGASRQEAAIVADLAETNIEVITAAEGVGRYQVIDEADSFDIEYWSLEQAKLGKQTEKPLARQIALVTGGGSGIGAATAAALHAAGAAVAVIDINGAAAAAVAGRIDGIAITADVTTREAVRRAIDKVVRAFGGLDIVVSNAGAAWQGRIGDVDDALLRKSFELNFWAHQTVSREAVRVMLAQATGGCLLFNVSKQAINPGPEFGPYGLPKAATLALMRQYALDYGRNGIRANAVNADRIRTGLLTDDMLAARAKARGVSEQDYMAGNLLGREVTAEDVAQGFVALALAEKTTAAVLTVDGGNIAAALR